MGGGSKRKRNKRSKRGNDQEGRGAGLEGSEGSQRNPRLYSAVEDVVEREPSLEGSSDDVKGKEVGQIQGPASASSISHGGESEGTQTAQHVLRPNESVPSATDENKSDQGKSAVSATAKFLLRGVRESADVFGPLKSVAGGLCFILENCEVRPSSHMHAIYDTHKCHSERRQIN